MATTLNLGVLASGRGSNFSAILKSIKKHELDAKINVLISNRKNAGALDIANQNQIPAVFISQKKFKDPVQFDEQIRKTLKKYNANFVVLAGYMRLLTKDLVKQFQNRILNIHPALLPSFGGKGMYGHHVHEAVVKRGCKVSGVTVHLVDEMYDHGPIIKQKCVPVFEGDTPESLAARVLKQEHKIYAEALQLFAENRIKVENQCATILPES
jgi:phosphoribosylglycinamide formyltransferase-1